ncbi:Phosphate-selective porin [Anaerohalosphaera lusitana]|uniref:Phosphate-selective porin n=1 Tax=Anaerohalosphaera lusitana TaxID=1936003 RepID=A0A1U9NJ89_9BACT|nr:porin [Anaerohalosphaera lusitana]AQT67857.1 Phosphate-selective porin [Anaerohalosphaera lusitana]
MRHYLVLFLVVFGLVLTPASFAEQDQENDTNVEIVEPKEYGEQTPVEKSWDEQLIPLQFGKVKVGGAFRFNYYNKDWNDDTEGDVDLDTLRVNFDLVDADPWIGSAEYRWYIPQNRGGTGQSYSFIHHAWLGYEFTDEEQIQAGVQQVPFGILPYASHNWFFQLPYYVGLEDDYDLGFKYIKNDGDWNMQLAYYPMDEGQGRGYSKDSARYSYDVVESDSLNSANEERHQFNGRVAYTAQHGPDAVSELGFSGQYSAIKNNDTDQYGEHYALGLHLDGQYGPWDAKLEAIRYDYNLDNPAGVSEDIVVMGAYDAPYNVAATGTMLVAGIQKTIPVNWGEIEEINVYNDYSVLFKDDSDFENSYQNVIGMSFALNRFFVYVDFAMGKRHPWLTGGWTNSLADGSGADGGDWQTRFNVNVGYYF